LEEFFVSARVILRNPMDSDGDTLIGYFINIGLSAFTRREVKSLVEQAVQDGRVDWTDSEWLDPRTLDPEIARFRMDAKAPIIWYKSDRILFPADKE
jgi:hypothetical protein